MSVATHYRRIRRDRPTEPASRAIFWARNMDKIDRLASRTEWEWTGDYTGAFLIGRVDGIERCGSDGGACGMVARVGAGSLPEPIVHRAGEDHAD